MGYLTIIRRRRSEYGEYLPRRSRAKLLSVQAEKLKTVVYIHMKFKRTILESSRGKNAPGFTPLDDSVTPNLVVSLVLFGKAFSFIIYISSSETSTNQWAAILKNGRKCYNYGDYSAR